jgi:hypothetical protein
MSNVIPFTYQGEKIRFNEQGWLNATDIAKRFQKEPNDWLMQRDSIRYLVALSKALGKSDNLKELSVINGLDGRKAASKAKLLRLAKKTGLVSTKAGANGGTWLHPKLAVAFGRWLDVDFAVWCDLHIDALLRGDGNLAKQLDVAEQLLSQQNRRGSTAGTELARHRWQKPPLVQRVNYLRDQLQLRLFCDREASNDEGSYLSSSRG